MAGTIPQQHITSGNTVDIITQVTVRAENHLRSFRETFNNLTGIRGSYHHICHRFHSSSCIHIRNNHMIRMLFYKFSKLRSRTTVCQRTACIQIGNQYLLIRTKNLRRFTHEMNTAKNNDIRRCFSRPLSQCQAVSYIICYILYISCLIIMSEDNRIFLFTQLIDGLLQIYIFRNQCVHISD